MLLTHHENVAWQTVEVCTWHLWRLVWVALRSMPKIVVDRLVRPDAAFGHFRCHFYGDRVAVTSNAAVAMVSANDAVSCASILGTHSCDLAMNAYRCVRYDLE